MDMSSFPERFPREFRRWAGHCALNAAPSFGIAVFWLRLRTFETVGAMICAIFTFVIGYAVLTSIGSPLGDRAHPIGRALRVGLIVRGWISIFSCFSLVVPWFLTFSPDLWAGFLAVEIVEAFWGFLGIPIHFQSSPATARFGEVYVTTLLEGLILSGLLFLISFTSLIVIQMLLRRRTIPASWVESVKNPGSSEAG